MPAEETKKRSAVSSAKNARDYRAMREIRHLQKVISFDGAATNSLPKHIKFYRISESTISEHFRMHKKPLSTGNCRMVERTLKLKPGTMYVKSDWMRMCGIDYMHREWNGVVRNSRTEFKAVQDRLSAYFARMRADFEATFAEYLDQPAVKDVYFAKTRERPEKLRAEERRRIVQQVTVHQQQQQQQQHPTSQPPAKRKREYECERGDADARWCDLVVLGGEATMPGDGTYAQTTPQPPSSPPSPRAESSPTTSPLACPPGTPPETETPQLQLQTPPQTPTRCDDDDVSRQKQRPDASVTEEEVADMLMEVFEMQQCGALLDDGTTAFDLGVTSAAAGM